MGRKIPGKKHRTVKDPYKQHAERYATLKAKINKPPKDPDDQPIPRSLKQLLSYKQKYEEMTKKTKKDGKFKNKNKVTKKYLVNENMKNHVNNPLKKMQKLKGESKKSFNMRINEALKTLKGKSTYKDVDELPKEKKMKENDEEKSKFKKKKKIEEPKLTKAQKRSIKEKAKKELYKENKEFEKTLSVKYDNVQFGEIVHEPPTLNIKPRKAEKIDGAARPARKDLLLNRLFETNSQSSNTNNDKSNKKNVDLQGKRKDLPDNVRRKLEESQKEAIAAYRQLKLTRVNQKI